jgi:hypothetical protein
MSEASTPPDRASAPIPPTPPIPKDAIDPELVRLRRPRPQIGAVTAISVVIFCAYVAVRLAGDRRFGGEPDAARDVPVADVVAGKVPLDAHVAVTARLERTAAVRAQPSPAHPGLRLAPVLGTADALWLALPGDGRSEPASEARYAGRLYELDELHIAEPVVAWLARPHPHFATGAELQRARLASADGGTLATVTGSELTVRGDTPVEIEVADPAAATVTATLNDRFPDAAAWTAALEKAGVLAAGARPVRETATGPVYDVRGPDAVADATRKVDAAGLGGARVDPVTTRHLAPWRELAATAAGVTVPGATLPWSAIDVAAVWLPRVPPPGARVLVVGEVPAQYWYVMPIYVAVIVFGLLFAWAAIRAVKRDFIKPRA